ncbi:MAG: DUF488 domain-containing protein [Acidimicrobiales bacterium]|jgi:uncharacterized protein YeaO (DUF488 family)
MKPEVHIARVYDRTGVPSGERVLVDRLWPRGVAKSAAPFAEWAKEVAPSAELRKWYGHAAERFEQFESRYRNELSSGPQRLALDELRSRARKTHLILMTATKDIDHSAAVVLRDVLLTS